MKMGTQIVAPEGFDQMPSDVVFHFLLSDPARKRVLLVHFQVASQFSRTEATLVAIKRQRFEEATDTGQILPCAVQHTLPPWLHDLEGIDLFARDLARSQAKRLHQSRLEDRLLHIYPHAREIRSILSADNPTREINRRASLCCPCQHETRFRLQLITYVCFGYNPWSLLPPFHRSGRWDRQNHPNTKFGAPSIAFGSRYGYPSTTALIGRCIEAYRSRAKLGLTMTEIYTTAMAEDFGCKEIQSPRGLKSYVHPRGDPFPTYWQFRYRVIKAFGLEAIQLALYGRVRHRRALARTRGHFSEELANIYEKVEADGYFANELPKGYIEGRTLKPLCVVTSIDLLTGMKLGIGFSIDGERRTAYRMMLFSMAVPKDYFCMLFGISCDNSEWPSEGLPPHLAVDRGPGGRGALIDAFEQQLPIREIAPSFSAQSKATTESSNPADIKIEGQPTYLRSKLTPVELARKEILRLISYNHTTDISERMDPDSNLAFVPPFPAALFSYYDKRGRNDALPMSIDDAVRTFLTPIALRVRDDGVWLEDRRFISDELVASGLLDSAARSHQPATKITGYMLDLCLRHVWIDVGHRLMLVYAASRTRDSEEKLWMSIQELYQWSAARQEVDSAFRVHKMAAASCYKRRFTEATGKSWLSYVRRTGKPKYDATARQEAYEARQHGSQKEVA